VVQEYTSEIEPRAEEIPSSGPPAPAPPALSPGPPPPYRQLEYAASVRITATSAVAGGPALFWGILLTGAASILAIVFDGQNASGRQILSRRTLATITENADAILPKPILCRNGIFVSLTGEPNDCTIIFEAIDEEQVPFLH